MSLMRLVVVLVFVAKASALPALEGPEEQRRVFKQADAALRAGESPDLTAVARQLEGYPLAPYVTYRALVERLDEVTADMLLAFVRRHEALPVTHGLERRWLMRAGADGRWADFRRVDRGHSGTSLACYRLLASRDANGVNAQWLDQARNLWLVGRSQPNACDPVFDELYDRGALTEAQRWERVNLLMASGQTRVARALHSRLDESNRRWLDAWLHMHSNPEQALSGPTFDVTGPMGRKLVAHGLRQLARRDPERAFEQLDAYRDRLDAEQVRALHRHIALQGAYSADPRAIDWLRELTTDARDSHVAEWMARAAVRAQDWPLLIEIVTRHRDSLLDDPGWRYWHAVALLNAGEQEAAHAVLEPLSERRQYYGFLAADLLERPYRMNHRPAARDDDAIAALARRPGLVRAREFFAIGGFDDYARREWHAALAQEDAATWRHAAQLALDWGWYGRVVDAATRAGLGDALELRFPLAFRDSMEQEIRTRGFDLALAYALVRKESAFEPEAVSHAGARGLMQLLPGTAREVSRELGEPRPSVADLFEPTINLRLGRAYLDAMLARFDGNLAMAAAAYNAGPQRTERWREDNAERSGPVWVEAITYRETRDYVKSVLAFRAVFDWQLGNSPRRLTDAMLSGGDVAWQQAD